MSDPVTLTFVRYPPRDLPERRGGDGKGNPARRVAAGVFALIWLPAGFHLAMSVAAGDMRWPANLDAWLLLATLAPGGLPLALACSGLWRRGHGVAACAAMAVLLPAIAAGTLVAEQVGPVAVVAFAVAASLPAWLLYAYLRLYRRAGRRGHRRNAW